MAPTDPAITASDGGLNTEFEPASAYFQPELQAIAPLPALLNFPTPPAPAGDDLSRRSGLHKMASHLMAELQQIRTMGAQFSALRHLGTLIAPLDEKLGSIANYTPPITDNACRGLHCGYVDFVNAIDRHFSLNSSLLQSWAVAQSQWDTVKEQLLSFDYKQGHPRDSAERERMSSTIEFEARLGSPRPRDFVGGVRSAIAPERGLSYNDNLHSPRHAQKIRSVLQALENLRQQAADRIEPPFQSQTATFVSRAENLSPLLMAEESDLSDQLAKLSAERTEVDAKRSSLQAKLEAQNNDLDEVISKRAENDATIASLSKQARVLDDLTTRLDSEANNVAERGSDFGGSDPFGDPTVLYFIERKNEFDLRDRLFSDRTSYSKQLASATRERAELLTKQADSLVQIAKLSSDLFELNAQLVGIVDSYETKNGLLAESKRDRELLVDGLAYARNNHPSN